MITGNFSGGDMKNRNKNSLTVCFFLAGAVVILTIGYQIYRQPYYEAERRNKYEDQIIEAYLEQKENGNPEEKPTEENPTEYLYSDVGEYAFQGKMDCILVIDKINLKKAVIRGNTLGDNEVNLSRYYFVTADLTQNLGGNYIIYGHCSDTYGHSFNRLEELNIGDTFYILQENMKYYYRIEAVDRVLRSESNPYFQALKNRVTFVSCEKNIASGYTENRVIIVRSIQTGKESIR